MYKPKDADVIIVGGGIAGLTAAHSLVLKEPTLHAIILEGSERVGGRAFAVPLLVGKGTGTVCNFDLGAQWICKQQNHLLKMLETLGICTKPIQKQGKIITHYHRTHLCERHAKNHFYFLRASERFQFTKFIVKVESICFKLKKYEASEYIGELNDITLEEFINRIVSSDSVKAVIEHMVLLSCGIRPNQVSALFYIFFCISTRGIIHQLPTEDRTLHELAIEGGSQTVCDKLVEEIGKENIITNEHVKAISVESSYVEVVGKWTTYRCSTVIVAIPPKDVLDIKFTPTLYEKHLEALNKTCTSTVTNFIATYEREFWRDQLLSGECYFFNKTSSRGPIDFCTSISSPGKIAILGRIFQGKISNKSFPTYRVEVLDQLARYLGEDAHYPIDYAEKSWTNHYCQMTGWQIGNINYFKHVYHPYDRLYFAGAETSPEWYGYMAGAVCSGMRAAYESLYLLRPAALTSSDIELMRLGRKRNDNSLNTYYGGPLYTAAEHWKMILSLCLVLFVAFWKLKHKVKW